MCQHKMVLEVRISSAVLAHIEAAAAASPKREQCGLLLGERGHVRNVQTSDNVADDPASRFEIDPAALFAALRAERAGGPALLGYWHTHPSGEASPSAHDAAMAAPDGKLWIIAGGGEVRGWRAVEHGAVHGRFDPVRLVATDAPLAGSLG